MKLTIIRIGVATSSDPLCRSCTNAHVVRGFRKTEELIYCNFGAGGPRLLEFAVSECSDYADRSAANAPAKTPAGFVKSRPA
jgi:hypothetical protein